MRKIKICHICPSFDNKLYQNFFDAQQASGHNLRVFFYHRNDEQYPQLSQKYLDDIKAFTKYDKYVYLLKVHKILKKYKEVYANIAFDVNHAHTLFTSGYVAYKEKKRIGTPYIVAVRGTDVNLYFKKRILLRGLGEKILLNSDAIVFLSKSHMNEVLDNYISGGNKETIRNKAIVIPNGIDDFWLDNPYSKELSSNTEIKLIYYGDINKNKNIETIIAVVRKLNESADIRADLTLIGKIRDKRYVQIVNSNDHVVYLEFSPKEKLREYLRQSDVFIMPSISETFGLAYVEAMSQGVPVLYTIGQGFDEQFPEGHVGFHVEPRNVEDIICKIKNVYQNYNSISKTCSYEAQNFSWEKITEKYHQLYDSVVPYHKW